MAPRRPRATTSRRASPHWSRQRPPARATRNAARHQKPLAMLRFTGRAVLDGLVGLVGRQPVLVPLASRGPSRFSPRRTPSMAAERSTRTTRTRTGSRRSPPLRAPRHLLPPGPVRIPCAVPAAGACLRPGSVRTRRATFGLLADGGTTQGILGANRLSLGNGADGGEPHYHARSWELSYVVTAPWRETSSWRHPGCPTRSAPPPSLTPTCWWSSLRASNGRIFPPSSTDRPRPGARRGSRARPRALRRPLRRQRHLDHDTRSQLIQEQSTRASTFG
jgi:hypothetical protein